MNRKSIRTENKLARALRPQRPWWSMPAACMATLLALPVNAVTIPDLPLTTGIRVAPNILFILDDSGSMAWENINNSDIKEITGSGKFSDGAGKNGIGDGYEDDLTDDTGNSKMYEQNYITNTVYYNPKTTYRAWMTAGGSRVPGGASYTSAFSDTNFVTYTDPLTSAKTSSGTINLSKITRTFYFPRDGVETNAALSKVENYFRYQILTDGKIVRSEWLSYTKANTSGTAGALGCATSTSGYDWRNCTEATPTGRTVDAEKANFAIWYSYSRTRIKAAKGGAAEAFNSQGRKVRVGYRSLHQNGSYNFNIPVGDGNDGRFVNGDTSVTDTEDTANTKSRSIWFNRLFAASAGSGTPLQSRLASAGEYFKSNAEDGPYGPEKGAAQFSCRQNFTVLTTDGYWNDGRVSTDDDGDGANGSVITNGPAAADGGVKSDEDEYKKYQYKAPAPYKDGNSNTLADVAMKYWKTDLRTDMANNVPSGYSKVASENDEIGRDPAFWQHMVTFTISIGLKTKSGLSSVADVNSSTTWNAPGDNDEDNIDDLLHAAVNGRGSFVSAGSPEEFANGLTAALATIQQRTGSFSNATPSNATSLNTGTRIFKANYVAGLWTGELKAESATDGSTTWAATIPAFATRQNKVFTYNGTSGATFPTAAQTTALDKTGLGVANFEVSGAENAAYIMGSQAKEGSGVGQLRVRTKLLGDVVNSSPTYVEETDTIYIGANDGMLHAFNASDGNEMFAYVPNIVNFGHLKNLSAGDYTHKWFVDGPIAVSRRSLGPGNTNILVGTLGRGGKGLYALDVTNPSSFAAANVKWERAETPENNMGLVLGSPVLAGVRNGGSTTPAVIFGNGINSASGKAVLQVLSLSDGSVIREIPTDSTTDNGLFAPTGLYAADGKTLVYVYAGDLQGNVWKFDMTSSNPSSWSASKIFHAEKTAGTPQPITSGLATAVDPRTNKRWVFFGTGSYMTVDDGKDKSAGAQSMYGVMDDGATYNRSNLTSRSVSDDIDGKRYFQELSSLSATSKGWYVDLTGEGERIVQNAQIDGSFLVTASMMPSSNSCDPGGGGGYINAITAFAGIASGKSYFDLDGNDETDDTGTAGKPTGSVKTNGIPTLPVLLPGQLIINTSGGATQKFKKGKALWNRVSWREIRSD